MRQLGPSKFPSRRMPVSNVSFRLASSLAAVAAAGFRRAGRSLRIGYLSRLAILWIQRGLGVGGDSWPPARLAKPSIIIAWCLGQTDTISGRSMWVFRRRE